jgi:quinoprotein glucose dehydrogenase
MPWIIAMVDLAARRGQVSAGEALYSVNCAVCHGVGRESITELNAPSLPEMRTRVTLQQTSRATARRVIDNGIGVMPGFAHLSENDREAVFDFLFGSGGRRARASAPPEIPYSHTGLERFLDEEGYPAITPPWGTLSAIDLDGGEILWQIPLGEFPELTAKGIPPTGTENYGGPIVTAGGLIFIAATKDEKFRAFDKETGESLWETELPAGGYATPSTFEIDGKQYVVIATGGGKMGTKSGDSYVAFALPQ